MLLRAQDVQQTNSTWSLLIIRIIYYCARRPPTIAMDYFNNSVSQRIQPAAPTHRPPSAEMASSSSSDVVILGLGVILAAIYLFKDSIFTSKAKSVPVTTSKAVANGGGNPRDFIAKMKEGVSLRLISSRACIEPLLMFLMDMANTTCLFLNLEEAPGHLLWLSDRYR